MDVQLQQLRTWLQHHLDSCDGIPNYGANLAVLLEPSGYCGYELDHGVEVQDVINKIDELIRGGG